MTFKLKPSQGSEFYFNLNSHAVYYLSLLSTCRFLLVQCRETKEEFIGLIINSELYLIKINAEICFKKKRHVTEIDFTAEHKRFYFFILSFSSTSLFVSLSLFCTVETSLWTGV